MEATVEAAAADADATPATSVVHPTTEEELVAILARSRPDNTLFMMDFGAGFCGPCCELGDLLEVWITTHPKDLPMSLCVVCIDVSEFPELADEEFSVTMLPTIILNWRGTQRARLEGFGSAEEFRGRVRSVMEAVLRESAPP